MEILNSLISSKFLMDSKHSKSKEIENFLRIKNIIESKTLILNCCRYLFKNSGDYCFDLVKNFFRVLSIKR